MQARAKGRYELKYVVPPECARAAAAFVKPYCDPDPFLEGAPEYTISSLYLDTRDLAFYRAKRVHQKDRVKARVRTYGPLSEGPVFLELKRRTGDVIMKTRVQVPRERWVDLATATGPLPTLPLRPHKIRVIDDFRAHVLGLSLRPVVTVRYEREPYVGRTDPGVRVTFDRRMRYAPATTFEIAAADRDFLPFDHSGMFSPGDGSLLVMEIKFDEHYPVWVPELIRRIDVARVSFSKYCNAVDPILSRGWTYDPGRLVPVTV
ncbi:MAG: polyphosphate polymerase domain-containing protein [Deltaproteobacteria bacterium]|nr:polyphosphate polymerase domain-containing protein [Deltaproteobacteria bacterium]